MDKGYDRAPGAAHGFRPDVEGLRALAILPILFNHAGVKGFLGGYIGVDIFFVISGFLITGILVRDVEAGQFSLLGFYRRRILRLMPALAAALVGTSVLAMIALTPPELVRYAWSLIATAGFGSNIYFRFTTGYFGLAATATPLLHTWSLAVEEQFYVFWPLLILLLARRGRAMLWIGVVLISLISLGYSAWLVQRDMNAAFYLLPSRVFEFGIGAVVALAPLHERLPRWLREGLGIAGGLAILASINLYRMPLLFPGLAAVVPCLGTAALIVAGPETLSGRLLSLAPVRFVGRISYSTYLWHWPIIVFSGLWLFLPQTPVVIAGQVALSLLVGWMSWRWIEVRGREWLRLLSSWRLVGRAAATVAIFAALAGIVLMTSGWSARFSREQNALAQVLDRDEEAAYRAGTCFVVDPDDRFDPACLAASGDRPRVLLIGNSAAAHLWPGFAASRPDFDVLQATVTGCQAGLYDGPRQWRCEDVFHDVLANWVPQNRPDAVLIAGAWVGGEPDPQLQPTLAYLRGIGQRAILVGPMPTYAHALPRLLFFGGEVRARESLDASAFDLDARMRVVAEREGAAYISPLDILCPNRVCQTVTPQGVPIQFDWIHLTQEGSALLVGRMIPAIDAAIRERPPGDGHPAAFPVSQPAQPAR